MSTLDIDLSGFDSDFEAAVQARIRRDDIRAEAAARRAQDLAHRASASWSGIRASDVPEREPERPSVLEFAPGRAAFYAGAYAVLFGDRDSAKTWCAYLAVVDQTRKGRAGLIIDYEMGADRVRERLQVLGASSDDLSRILIVEPDGHLSDSARERLIEAVDAVGAPLGIVVLDSTDESLGRAALDPLRSVDVAEWVADVPRWVLATWPGAAFVAVDHTPLTAQRRPAGSARKSAAADQMFVVQMKQRIWREGRGYSLVTPTKDRAGFLDYSRPLFRLDGGGGQPFEVRALTEKESAGASAGAALRDEIERVLRERGGWVTIEHLRGAVGGSAKSVTEVVGGMVSDGLIEKAHGKGVRLPEAE